MRAKFLGVNLFVLILFILDRATKYFFVENPSFIYGEDFILSLRYATNNGIAFGLSVNTLILQVLVIGIIFFLIHELLKAYHKHSVPLVLSLSLIVAGAFSNLMDRFQYGFVVDFIDLEYFTVFNIADAMITVGVVILLIEAWLAKKH